MFHSKIITQLKVGVIVGGSHTQSTREVADFTACGIGCVENVGLDGVFSHCGNPQAPGITTIGRGKSWYEGQVSPTTTLDCTVISITIKIATVD